MLRRPFQECEKLFRDRHAHKIMHKDSLSILSFHIKRVDLLKNVDVLLSSSSFFLNPPIPPLHWGGVGGRVVLPIRAVGGGSSDPEGNYRSD